MNVRLGTNVLLKDFISEGRAALASLYGETEAAALLAMLCGEMLGVERHTHLIYPEYEIDGSLLPQLQDALARLTAGEPLQYIIGKAEFYGRTFRVASGVLIPRPETELLCRRALAFLSSRPAPGSPVTPSLPPAEPSPSHAPRILDLCTGSGCIAWTMALECRSIDFPLCPPVIRESHPELGSGSDVVAVDISDEALAIAASQPFEEYDGAGRRIAPHFIKADVLGDLFFLPPAEPSPSVQKQRGGCLESPRKFDLILSNPPYIRNSEKTLMQKNVLEHEPALALFVEDDDPLIFYRAIARWARELLADDGLGIVEINEAFGAETAEVFRAAGFAHAEVIKDLNGKDRFVEFAIFAR